MDALIAGAVARPAMAAVILGLVVVVLFAIFREVVKVGAIVVVGALAFGGYWVYSGRSVPAPAQRVGVRIEAGSDVARAAGADLEVAARKQGRAKAEKALRKDQYGDGIAPHPTSPAP